MPSTPRDQLAAALPDPETRAGYLLWLSRPRFWLYLAGPVLVGLAFGADRPTELFSPVAVGLFAYFLLPANVYLYGVNDAFDVDADAYNEKKAADGPEVRFRRDAPVVAVVVASGALAPVLAAWLPTAAAASMVAWLALATAYSVPPVRLKTVPLLDSVSNGLYVLPGVAAYAAFAGILPPIETVAGGWLWSMGMHTFSAVPDIEPDRDAGIRTTATVLGKRRSLAYCGACWFAAAVVFTTVHPVFGGILAVYPVFALVLYTSDVAVDRAYWWFPAVNTVVGTAFTLVGLWVTLYG